MSKVNIEEVEELLRDIRESLKRLPASSKLVTVRGGYSDTQPSMKMSSSSKAKTLPKNISKTKSMRKHSKTSSMHNHNTPKSKTLNMNNLHAKDT